jgi:2-C-methyl-D-erythritol 2,4-cyclodiphosphate synthase
MIGIGYDIHQLAEGETLILGGINIESEIGTIAHSDGDVLVHSIIDAMLGAASLGDIGDYFPDTDEQYKNINSIELLMNVYELIKNAFLKIVNIDVSIILEKPKLANYKIQIKENIAEVLKINTNQINIKATTNEKQDSIGNKKSIAVLSVCQLQKEN